MDINELNKKQLILLTLLITFVVSIATGIVTVSLMKQMPVSVPQTINNVIQRTIEKVSTVTSLNPVDEDLSNKNKEDSSVLSLIDNSEVVVSIYPNNETLKVEDLTTSNNIPKNDEPSKELGQGIIISDVGLILVDSSILGEDQIFKIVLNKIDFDAKVLKKFNNGFTVLKIFSKITKVENTTAPSVKSDTPVTNVD